MKDHKYLFALTIVYLLACGCKKELPKTYNVSSLTIVNATIGSNSVDVNFTTSPIPFYQNNGVISYGSSAEYSNPSGNIPLIIYSSQDTVHALYSNTLKLNTASIYSLYLAGQESNVETLLVEDKIPAFADSTAGVRFINLSLDSKPVTVNLQGNPPSQVEFSGALSYKQITPFKSYSDNSVYQASGYTFEIRDAATGNLLTTYTWNIKPFSCNTIVIEGLENDNTGNYPVSAFQVNNY